MNKEYSDLGDRVYRYSLMAIPVIFYLVFWLIDKAVWCADSASYVEMHDCREPLYPSLLWFFRLIFKVGKDADPTDNISLLAMTFVQSMLAAGAAYSIAAYLIKRFKPKKYIGYIILAIPMGVSLINRFVAARSAMYSNSILTEGLTISIYLLAVRYMYEYLEEGSLKSLVLATDFVIIGVLTRKQMFVLAVLLVIAIIFSHIKRKIPKKMIKPIIIVLFCIVSIDLLMDCAYNKMVHGVFTMHSEDNRFVTTMAIYTSEREYVEYIESEFKELFLKIYDECDENGWLMHDSPKGWFDEVNHFSANYDYIQLNTMEVILLDAVQHMQSARFTDDMTESMKMDVIRASFNKSLLPHEKARLFKVFTNNVLAGFADTVVKRTRILSVASIFIFAFYVLAMVMSMKATLFEAADLGALVLLSILGNVSLVSAVIFCQTRYTVYNMPLFYIALVIMISEYFRYKRKSKDV